MKLSRPSPRPMPQTIIALVDVVFFLLVFFMLIGRMDANAPFEVIPPQADGGESMPGGGMTISVSVEGEFSLDGIGYERGEILEIIASRLESEPGTLVRINAHKAADLRGLLPFVTELASLGAKDVVLVATPGSP